MGRLLGKVSGLGQCDDKPGMVPLLENRTLHSIIR